jgi:hypothetical protein
MMCDVPSVAVFCSESTECFPGIIIISIIIIAAAVVLLTVIRGKYSDVGSYRIHAALANVISCQRLPCPLEILWNRLFCTSNPWFQSRINQ